MASQFYVRRQKKVIGPVAGIKLKQQVAAGTVLPTDQVSDSPDGPWHFVADVPPLNSPPATESDPVVSQQPQQQGFNQEEEAHRQSLEEEAWQSVLQTVKEPCDVLEGNTEQLSASPGTSEWDSEYLPHWVREMLPAKIGSVHAYFTLWFGVLFSLFLVRHNFLAAANDPFGIPYALAFFVGAAGCLCGLLRKWNQQPRWARVLSRVQLTGLAIFLFLFGFTLFTEDIPQGRVDVKTFYSNLARQSFKRGYEYYWRKNFDDAIADYTEVIRLRPDLAEAYFFRGLAYSKKGEYDKAIADYTEAIRLNPDDADAYVTRGTAYAKKREFDKAIVDFSKAIELEPDDAAAYNNRGLTYGEKGEHDKAIVDITEVIRLNPDDADAYFNRGLAYGEKGEHDKAIADFTEVIRLNPDDADAYFYRGTAYDELGDKAKAKADFAKVIRLPPDDAAAYFTRGSAYDELGDKAKAEADFAKAKELGYDP